MKTLLVDDEEKSIRALRSLLQRYCPEVEIIGEAGSATRAIELIGQLKPDLVFLDILMPDGTGFDVLDRCAGRSFEVIFVTAFEEHSLRAFRFAALHYLLKPLNYQELQEAVARYPQKENRLTEKERSQRIEVAKSAMGKAAPESIVLPTLEGFSVIRIPEIVRCEADSNYTKVFFANGKSFLASRNLSHFEELLAGLSFVRVHHKHLVNLLHIKRYIKGRGGFVEMNDGLQVEVSARKKDEFLERMAAFARGMD